MATATTTTWDRINKWKLCCPEILRCQGFCQDWKLRGIQKHHFTKSEWSDFSHPTQVSPLYMLWRFIYLCFISFAVIFNALKVKEYSFIFLTKWSLLLQFAYSLLFFGHHFYSYFNRYYYRDREPAEGPHSQSVPLQSAQDRDNQDDGEDSNVKVVHEYEPINHFESIIWLLFTIKSTFSILVTLGYWAFVKKGFQICYTVSHGFNALFSVVDLMVVALPVRVAHFIYPVTFGVLYVLFTYLYEVSGGNYSKPGKPYVYSFLNWRQKPGQTIGFSFLSPFVFIIVHLLVYGLYLVRLSAVSWWNNRRRQNRNPRGEEESIFQVSPTVSCIVFVVLFIYVSCCCVYCGLCGFYCL